MSTVVTSTVVPDADQEPSVWRVVNRVVFPVDGDDDTLRLYLDRTRGAATAGGGRGDDAEGSTEIVVDGTTAGSDDVRGRRSLNVEAGTRVSLGTYFNAFPASYWRRWTVAEAVRLTVRMQGDATIVVYRSNARGHGQRVESRRVSDGEATFDLPLKTFGDGGWYWFDVAAGRDSVTMVQADWSVLAPERPHGTLSIGITTFNRPDYCVAQIRALAGDDLVREVLDRVYIVDQGTSNVVDDPGYPEAAALIGDTLQIVRQDNLGGSGGFARGMYETLRAGTSDYVLLLDDDVVLETEGLLRAVAFADMCRQPTLVGGHMFNMYERSVLHSFGERIDKYRFFWGPVQGTQEAHDFATTNLRRASWMHKRVDVEFNGWWMCLIPTAVVEEIGLALPVFIKWDDAEYGTRAGAAGHPTVTLPGAAVWHVPWTDKDDTIDWQAYYHQRNRWLAALLYSPYSRGGNLPKESALTDIKHLLSLRYSALELRLMALEDLLDGPERLHADLGSKLPEIRRVRAGFDDASPKPDPSAFPAVRRSRPPRRGVEPTQPRGALATLGTALAGALRQVRPVRAGALERPEAEVAAMDGAWWRLSQVDSALVSTADGAGVAWHRRDPRRFRSMLSRSARLHERLYLEWPALARRYQEAFGDFTSVPAWEATFERHTVVQAEPSDRIEQVQPGGGA